MGQKTVQEVIREELAQVLSGMRGVTVRFDTAVCDHPLCLDIMAEALAGRAGVLNHIYLPVLTPAELLATVSGDQVQH